MKEFSDLPYELRLSILKTSRRNAFKEKIGRFETIFTKAQNQWISQKHLYGVWSLKHRILGPIIAYHIQIHWGLDIQYIYKTDESLYTINHIKLANGKWRYNEYKRLTPIPSDLCIKP